MQNSFFIKNFCGWQSRKVSYPRVLPSSEEDLITKHECQARNPEVPRPDTLISSRG